MEIFDSHSHLNDEKFKNLDEVIDTSIKNNVKYITIPGYSINSSIKAIEIAKKYKNCFALIGIHPEEAEKYKNEDDIERDINVLRQLYIQNKKVIVGIGEIGLDYYWTKEYKHIQNLLLEKQIKLANELNLPIALHIREATNDILNILKKNNVNKKGIFHCCPLNDFLIKQGVELGYYISFSGVITFKNVKNLNLVNIVPDNKLLVETDAPYLAPEPFRGKQNFPYLITNTINKIAEIKKCDSSYIAEITKNNAMRIYNINS